MKKNCASKTVFMGIIVLTSVLAFSACSSSNAAVSQNDINSSYDFFDGFWDMPDGNIMYVKKAAFVIFTQGGEHGLNGVFGCNDTLFEWDIDKGKWIGPFNYTKKSNSEFLVSSEKNPMANGIWKKSNGISFTSNNPLVGYWESATTQGLQILHIVPFGWGTWYFCDTNGHIISRKEIEFDDNKHSEFSEPVTSGTREFAMTHYNKFNYTFDGPDLLVDKRRFTRK